MLTNGHDVRHQIEGRADKGEPTISALERLKAAPKTGNLMANPDPDTAAARAIYDYLLERRMIEDDGRIDALHGPDQVLQIRFVGHPCRIQETSCRIPERRPAPGVGQWACTDPKRSSIRLVRVSLVMIAGVVGLPLPHVQPGQTRI